MPQEIYRIGKLVPCIVKRRINRFVVEVYMKISETRMRVHINNTGKLEDVLSREAKGYCYPIHGRKLSYRLFSVEYHGGFAVIDTGLQEKSFAIAVDKGAIPWLSGCVVEGRSPKVGKHRLDYILVCGNDNLLVETKSAVLADNEGYALYPDTPSYRGRNHIKLLTRLALEGQRTLLLFIAAFPNAMGFKPNRNVDPILADLVKEAAKSGVNIRSIGLMFDPATRYIILYNSNLPIRLE